MGHTEWAMWGNEQGVITSVGKLFIFILLNISFYDSLLWTQPKVITKLLNSRDYCQTFERGFLSFCLLSISNAVNIKCYTNSVCYFSLGCYPVLLKLAETNKLLTEADRNFKVCVLSMIRAWATIVVNFNFG